MRGIVDLPFSLRRLPWIPGQSRFPRSFLDAFVTLDVAIAIPVSSSSIGIFSLPLTVITSSTIARCIFIVFCVALQWTYRNCRLPDYPRLVKSESLLFTAFWGLAM